MEQGIQLCAGFCKQAQRHINFLINSPVQFPRLKLEKPRHRKHTFREGCYKLKFLNVLKVNFVACV